MELELAGVLGSEDFGRTSEMPGELGDVADIALDGFGRHITRLHVLNHSLSQRSHGRHHRSRGSRRRMRVASIVAHVPESAQDRIIATPRTSALQGGGSRDRASHEGLSNGWAARERNALAGE